MLRNLLTNPCLMRYELVLCKHYDDVIMSSLASQITSLKIVYPTVHSRADQRKHQSSASLAFVWGIRRSPVNSPHREPVTRKMFPFDDVIMNITMLLWVLLSGTLGVQKRYLIHSFIYFMRGGLTFGMFRLDTWLGHFHSYSWSDNERITWAKIPYFLLTYVTTRKNTIVSREPVKCGSRTYTMPKWGQSCACIIYVYIYIYA